MKPNIAYVMTPITFGGAERVNLNFLKYADRDKFIIDPILFLRPWEKENIFENELKLLGLDYYIIPVANSENSNILRIIGCYRAFEKIIKNKNYDLIHTHGYMADLMGYVASSKFKIPIISTCHGFIYGDRKLSFYNIIDQFALKYFTRVISVSEPIKIELINKGINKDKVTVIENTPSINHNDVNKGITRDIIRKYINTKSEEILIAYVGRLSNEKGIRFLIESMKLLEGKPQSFKLVLIGEGCQEDELKEMVSNNGLTSKITFAGFQKNIDEWFPAIDIFVLPSLTEGTPMVLLEAMAHGLPCIASAVGGIPKVIDSGVDGILVTPGKPEEICRAIIELCEDKVKKDSISINSKIKIRTKYDINKWTNNIENVYINSINNRKS